MAERSLFWDGIAVGDAVAVTQTHLHDWFYRSVINGTGNRGPIKGWRDELEVTGISSPITVAAGGACVYGMLFDSDSAATVNVSTPTSGTSRYDLIVARRTWAVQGVRIARVAGVAGVIPAVPTVTQTAGTIWEVPLATLLIDDAGNITTTNTREFCTYTTEWPANIVTAGMYEEGAISAALRPDLVRYDLKGAGQFTPDNVTPCTRAAGASYDFWNFADAAFNRGWAYFLVPEGIVGNPTFYIWSTPVVNGAGAGVENCQFDYSIYYGSSGTALTNVAGTVNADQQLRVNTTPYADQVPAAGVAAGAGQIVAYRISRDGVADSYNSAMQVHGVEMRWTADA